MTLCLLALLIPVLPNADGVLDAAAAVAASQADSIPNPFVDRSRSAEAIREIVLNVGSVLVGEKPENASAIINGRIYAPGDVLEGARVSAVTAETIDLLLGNLLLRIPVGDRPVKLRIGP